MEEHEPSRGGASRPRIAMLADRREASFGAWRDVSLSFAWTHYVEALDQAGAAPIIVPAVASYETDPDPALAGMDGLLLTGGRDIEAAFYGADRHPASEQGDLGRDRIEAAIARRALELGLPVLGVCRGMQLLNLIRGGELEPHLTDPDGIHRGEPGAFVAHPVELESGSLAARALGSTSVGVRSHHHQGLGRIGDGLVVSGRAPDGVAEAVEDPSRPFCLAVLWHPEEGLDEGGSELYGAFVDAARVGAGASA